MSTNIYIHLYEEDVEIKVNNSKDETEKIIYLGNDAAAFLTNDQTEELFDKLDMVLHKKTWLQMEESALSLEVYNEELQSTIDYYRELREENRAI